MDLFPSCRNGLLGLFLVNAVLTMPAASAVPVALQLSADGTTITCHDGDVGCDSNPLTGAVTFVGSVGGWLTNITTALTAPALGTADHATLHLDNVNLSSALGGTISIVATAQDYTGPVVGAGAPLSAALGGLTQGRVDADFYVDDGNRLFATDTTPGALLIAHLDSTMGATGTAFAASAGGIMSPVAAPFALTIAATVSHAGASASSFNAEIPEPVLPWYLLYGLFLVASYRSRWTHRSRQQRLPCFSAR